MTNSHREGIRSNHLHNSQVSLRRLTHTRGNLCHAPQTRFAPLLSSRYNTSTPTFPPFSHLRFSLLRYGLRMRIPFHVSSHVLPFHRNTLLAKGRSSGALTTSRALAIITLICVLTMCSGSLVTAAEKTRPTPTPSLQEIAARPDMRTLVSRADLHYQREVKRSEAGLPLGNGRMGSLVWTSGDALQFQLNRPDVFAVNKDCAYTVDYCSGLAKVAVNFGHEVFPADNVDQHLSLYDGVATIGSGAIRAEMLAWHERDAMAIRVSDARGEAGTTHVDLKMLRPHWVQTGTHRAMSKFELDDSTMVLQQTFTQKRYYCRSAVAIVVEGRQATVEKVDSTTARLTIEPGEGDYTIWMGSAASFDTKEDVAAQAVAEAESAARRGYQRIREENLAWWHDFWSKSFVELSSADGVAEGLEQGYTYYLYIMGATSRGAFPPKFNGMLFSTGDDVRRWGSKFWWWNTQTLYWTPLAANHPELMDPLYDMYSGMLDSAAVAARQQWGSEGIFIPETVDFDGLAKLPENIAAELQDLLLERKLWEDTSPHFRGYCLSQNGFASRWNFIHAPQAMPHSWITHIFFSQAQIAWHYWLRYEYLQDEAWLRDRAYPMLRGVAQFYRTYPNIKKGEDGRYHIYNVNNGEGVWGGQDPHEEIAAVMGVLPLAIKASEILGVDEELRDGWRDLLENMAPLPTNLHVDAVNPRLTRDGVVWTPALKPAKKFNNRSVGLRPAIHFDLVTLETPPSELKRMAQLTYESRSFTRLQAAGAPEKRQRILTQNGIVAANMGAAEDVQELLPRQVNRVGTDPSYLLANRMSLEEGVQTQGVEHLGSASYAIQRALCQSIAPRPGAEPVIHLFPAWPRDWAANFELLCRRGFLVRSSIESGQIPFVEITSQLGGDCRLRNPWNTTNVEIRRGESIEVVEGQSLLVLQTKPGEKLLLLPSRS